MSQLHEDANARLMDNEVKLCFLSFANHIEALEKRVIELERRESIYHLGDPPTPPTDDGGPIDDIGAL